MKFQSHRHIDSETLRRLIPKRYQQQFRSSDFETADAALLMFRLDRKVVLSSVAQQALESLKDLTENCRVAIGGNFTHEAARMLADAGFRVYSLSEFEWSDERYKKITKAQ